MKKIISAVIFIAALSWTWCLVHSPAEVDSETHSGIQAQMAELIKTTLATKKPTATDLKIRQLYTENMNENKIKAIYIYSYVDAGTEGSAQLQTVQGEAVLHRSPSETEGVDQWVFQSVKNTGDTVAFAEGSTISPNMATENAETAAEQTDISTDGHSHSDGAEAHSGAAAGTGSVPAPGTPENQGP